MVNNNALVGIVIVNYNGEKYQNDCIKSIKEMKYDNLFIVVVDSNSQDDSIKKLKKEYSDVVVLQQEENCGVAKGNNIGIKYCLSKKTDYIMLLNNDVVLDTSLLSELLKEANREIVVVPKIYYYEPYNMLWYGGGDILWNKGSTIHYGIKEEDKGQYDEKKSVNYSPTCCMLIHSSIFDKVGLMDENVFMYYDDTDFCVRLSEANIKIVYVPMAKMWHKVSSSSGGEDSKIQVYYMTRNRLYFIDKYKDKLNLLDSMNCKWMNFKNLIKYMLYPIRHKNDKMILEACRDYQKGNMGRKDFC